MHRLKGIGLWYATWGVKHRPLAWMRQTYRRRFGIASSSRHVQQAKSKTSSRNPVLHLLFVGVALVLCNGWGWWHAEGIAQPQRGGRRLAPTALRFPRLLLWLVVEVAKHYRLVREISVHRDMYEIAQELGISFNYCLSNI